MYQNQGKQRTYPYKFVKPHVPEAVKRLAGPQSSVSRRYAVLESKVESHVEAESRVEVES